MTFQSTVNVLTNLGVPGDIVLDEPNRVQPVTLDANGGYLANFFVKNGLTGVASQGGVVGQGSFTGTATLVSGSPTITIVSVTAGAVTLGQTVTGTDIPASTTIIGYGTGAGGAGTYTMSANASATVGSAEAVTGASGTPFVLGGIAVNSKVAPLYGTSVTNPLAPGELIEPNGQVPMMTMGSVVVNIPNAFNIGDVVTYQVTTGDLGSQAPSATLASGYALVPNAVIYGMPSQGGVIGTASSGGGLALVRLTN